MCVSSVGCMIIELSGTSHEPEQKRSYRKSQDLLHEYADGEEKRTDGAEHSYKYVVELHHLQGTSTTTTRRVEEQNEARYTESWKECLMKLPVGCSTKVLISPFTISSVIYLYQVRQADRRNTRAFPIPDFQHRNPDSCAFIGWISCDFAETERCGQTKSTLVWKG